MPLRLRLILAFLLLSVVPLGAVTVYSYVSNRNALRAAAAHEADQLAGELKQRMQLVTSQLSDRVEQLMDISASAEPVVRTSDTSPAPKVAKATPPKTSTTPAPTAAAPGTSVEPKSML